VEHGLIEPLEQALAQVEGVERIEATARLGSARLTAAFGLGRNIDLALQDVQAKVAQAQRSLPKDVQQPTVSKSNPDDQPLLTVGVRGPFARQLLADVARYQVQDRIQTVSGVGQITLNGYLDRNIRIWVDADRMNEKKVAVTDIINAIKREHVDVPGGQFETGGRQLSVRLHPEVALYLVEQEPNFLRQLEKQTGLELEVRDDPMMRLDEFRMMARPAGRDVTEQYAVA